MKPTGKNNYGSIPHLLGSKLGKTDKYITEGQHNICTLKTRDKNDLVIVQEKYDGSNTGVARIGNKIFALTRSGYEAHTSPYKQHHYFGTYVESRKDMFLDILEDGERICGEWMIQAHGLRYRVDGNPFVAFDIFDPGNKRVLYDEFFDRTFQYNLEFSTPKTVCRRNFALPIREGLFAIDQDEYHPIFCIDKPEGLVYRVERNGRVDFLAKYVRPDHVAGKYLTHISGNPEHWNELCEFE